MAVGREIKHVLFTCPKLGRGVRVGLIYLNHFGPRFGDKPVLAGFDCEGAEECGVKMKGSQFPMWSRCVHPMCPQREDSR